MQRRVRYARERVRPEIFGLSTLDTVTCALAGSIVLMIFMAAFTDPSADIQLTDLRVILQSGTGQPSASDTLGAQSEEAPFLEKLVVLHFVFDQGQLPAKSVSAKGCKDAVTVSRLRSPTRNFDSNAPDKEPALIAWRNQGTVATDCNHFTISIEPADLAWVSQRCDVTLVSAAHVQRRSFGRCPSEFKVRSNDDDVYRFSRLGF